LPALLVLVDLVDVLAPRALRDPLIREAELDAQRVSGNGHVGPRDLDLGSTTQERLGFASLSGWDGTEPDDTKAVGVAVAVTGGHARDGGEEGERGDDARHGDRHGDQTTCASWGRGLCETRTAMAAENIQINLGTVQKSTTRAFLTIASLYLVQCRNDDAQILE
jgi:hypothetical protein